MKYNVVRTIFFHHFRKYLYILDILEQIKLLLGDFQKGCMYPASLYLREMTQKFKKNHLQKL